jgi:membrane protein implicated in regulation of membrane protease activity
MDALLLWIATACLLAVAEMFTMGLFLAPFALGAAVAGSTAWAGAGLAVSLGVFAVASLLVLLGVRPLLLARRLPPTAIRTGTAALIGLARARAGADRQRASGHRPDWGRGVDRARLRRG